MPDKEDDGNFLSRWSRRKRMRDDEVEEVVELETTDEPVAEKPMAIAAADTALEQDTELAEPSEPTEEELEIQANIEAAEAVDLETLAYESDFEVFMKKGVPDAIKNAAMQKLWRSNPVLAVLDGLNDYDEDFGDPKLNVYKSAWEVGRGFLTDDEMNHNPADKVKALVEKWMEEPVEATTAIASETTQEEQEDDTQLAANDPDDEPADNEVEIEETDEAEVSQEPVRVSMRSRIFDDAQDKS